MTQRSLSFAAALSGVAVFASNALADAPSLLFPVDCELGDTCFLQQFVDRDEGPDASDFTCGPQSYDGHQGTDIRLADFEALSLGWRVLAAASGTVLGSRNTVADGGIAMMPEGQDCGNGVVLDHGDGWQTQYCHLAQGSVTVQQGDTVEAGAALGEIGFSGRSEFPHLHMTLRHNGQVIDPFDPTETAACGIGAPDLWIEDIVHNAGDVMSVGFAQDIPEFEAIKQGNADVAFLTRTAPALVLWGFVHSARAGDQIRVLITGPDGVAFHEQLVELNRTQAQLFRASGRRAPNGGLQAGLYRGQVSLLRDGAPISQRNTEIEIR